jgi:membrane fusion protein, copper/silver efflux system
MRLDTVVRSVAYTGVLAAAIGVSYLATRKDASATMAPGHQHATAARASAGPVALTDADARRIGVTFAPVVLGSLSKEVRTVGQVTFDETRLRTISPKIDGWVEQLFVNATGQPVVAGQPLLAIYSPMLVTAQEELLLAKRLETDVSGAASDARERASELVVSARRRLASWDIAASEIGEIERTGSVHRTLTLRAASGGYVLEKNVTAGQRIMAGDALYRLADLSTVWVEGEVFEQDLASVRAGQSVEVDFQALPGEHRAGRISYVYPTLNPETRTVRVRVVIGNDALLLKPGMYATVRIAAAARRDVLTVPRSAVLSTGERSIVFVRDATGRLAAREVSVGATNDDRVEVIAGVSAGEIVVSSATFLIDAESNLSTALGGMGDMPGMDMTSPPKPLPAGRSGEASTDHAARSAPPKR